MAEVVTGNHDCRARIKAAVAARNATTRGAHGARIRARGMDAERLITGAANRCGHRGARVLEMHAPEQGKSPTPQSKPRAPARFRSVR